MCFLLLLISIILDLLYLLYTLAFSSPPRVTPDRFFKSIYHDPHTDFAWFISFVELFHLPIFRFLVPHRHTSYLKANATNFCFFLYSAITAINMEVTSFIMSVTFWTTAWLEWSRRWVFWMFAGLFSSGPGA